jgi:hypothetical protein
VSGLQVSFDSLPEQDGQLLQGQGPVSQWHGPFLADSFRDQAQKFDQRCFIGKNTLDLGHLPQLPMKTFNRIGGVNHFPDGGRIILKAHQACPVPLPTLDH